MLLGEEVTSEGLKKELISVENALAKNEKNRRRIQEGEQVIPARERLSELQSTVECLSLAHDVSIWAKEREESPEKIMEDAKQCIALGEILLRHSESTPSKSGDARAFFDTLLKDEYNPLHDYVRQELLRSLRHILRDIGYPAEEACAKLVEQGYDELSGNTVSACCHWLSKLQAVDEKLRSDMREIPTAQVTYTVVELSRPIVERVRYHFVEQSEDRISSKRIDRLPEWLFTYLREHVFEEGPWEYIASAPWVGDTSYFFLSEMVSLAHFVLSERHFFQSDRIVGPSSTPMLLSRGIEQLLEFDSFIRALTRRPLLGLTQMFVSSNAELWDWWVERERESMLASAFETKLAQRTDSRVSPRAELFCSLIHSIRTKAALLDNPTAYYGKVAVPLCMQFLDAIHTAATDLRNLLSQRKIPNDENLAKNLLEWVELVNGTNLAAALLLQGDTEQYGLVLSMGATAHGDHDLERVGRSMERLRDVLVDECATSLVETVIIGHAGVAGYILRCSNLLASTEFVRGDEPILSADLREASHVFSRAMDSLQFASIDQGDEYGALAIRTNIMDRFADQLLEVALDAHGMTPDIYLPGAIAFADDVNLLFSELSGTPLTNRLLDVARFMAADSKSMHDLRMALFELSRQLFQKESSVPLLNLTSFTSDGTLLDEAISMIRAKGYSWLLLEDAISVLNRRKDSFL